MKIFNSILVLFIVFCFSSLSLAAPPAPGLTVQTSGQQVSLTWNSVAGAAGYELLYADYPNPAAIYSLDLGLQTAFSVSLPVGSAFYVAVKAYDSSSASDFSNIEYFVIGSTTPPPAAANTVDVPGTWSVTTAISGCSQPETGTLTVNYTNGVMSASYSSANGLEADCSFSGPWSCGGSPYAASSSQMDETEMLKALNVLLSVCDYATYANSVTIDSPNQVQTSGSYMGIGFTQVFSKYQ